MSVDSCRLAGMQLLKLRVRDGLACVYTRQPHSKQQTVWSVATSLSGGHLSCVLSKMNYRNRAVPVENVPVWNGPTVSREGLPVCVHYEMTIVCLD